MLSCAEDYLCSVLHTEAGFEYGLSQIIDNEITYVHLSQTWKNTAVFALLQIQFVKHVTLHS